MRVRNNTAYNILKDIVCPECGKYINIECLDWEVFDGLKDETGKAKEGCIAFNEMINGGLCSEGEVHYNGLPFLQWLAQYRQTRP